MVTPKSFTESSHLISVPFRKYCFIYVHAVILLVLKCLFILVCRSKSPTGRILHVVQYSTQTKISMSMSVQAQFTQSI